MNRNIELEYNKMRVKGFSDIKKKCKYDSSYIFGRDENGNTMLHYAACDGSLDVIEQLMSLGSCPFIYNNIGMTPLSNAAGCDNVSALKFLIEKSYFGLLDDDRAELMAIAASKGKYENLEFMLNNGFNCNVCYRTDPILYWALQSAKLDIIRLLCEHGADVNAVNDEGAAPVFDASAAGLTDILEYLINHGACVDNKTNDGSTPLIIACCYNQIDVVKILLSNKCNIEIKTNDGITALLYAIGCGNTELVQLLLNNGANRNVIDNKNKGITVYCNRIKNKKIRNTMKEILQI